MLDIEEHVGQAPLDKAGRAGAVSLVAILLQAGKEEVVLHGDTPQHRAVAGFAGNISGSEDFADFKAAGSTADDACGAGVALAVCSGEAADTAQEADAYEMLP